MTNITLAPLAAADLPAVLDLWAQTDGVGLNESDSPQRLGAYLQRNPNLSLVARDGPRLAGAVLCGHDGRRGYLNHLAVAPEYRGQGLGRRMVETCQAALAALGILKTNVFVYADNAAGEEFWTRCGWAARSDLRVLQRPTSACGREGEQGSR